MAKRVDLQNLPYRPILSISREKIDGLFGLMNQMDTQYLKQFSMINNVPLNVDDSMSGDNLIHKAINIENTLKKEFHRLNIIKFLFQNGVNPDKPNKENQTALHLACKYQYHDIAEYLISLGVNVNFQDNYGATPFHYALQGQLKLMVSDKSIKDFIPPQKKVDVEKQQKLVEIKKDVWALIKDSPFISAIKQTTEGSIYSNDSIKKKAQDFYNKITKVSLDTKVPNYLNSIKEEIEILRNSIETSVKSTWRDFPEVSDIDIHEKILTSYDLSGNDYSPLKNINIKEQIKENIQKNKDEIKKLCDIKIGDEPDVDDKLKEKLNDIYTDFFINNESSFIKWPGTNIMHLNNIGIDTIPYWDTLLENNLHKDAIDYADNCINWDKMEFIGGSREMSLDYNFDRLTYILTSDILDNIHKKVYFILADLDDTHNFLGFDIGNIRSHLNNISYGGLEKLKINLAYNVIFKQDIYKLNPNNPGSIEQMLFDKWSKLFISKDKASVLYAMYCEVGCFDSDDNLTGRINCEIAMLVSALKIKTQSLEKALETSMKKYFIAEELQKKGGNPEVEMKQLSSALNILLSEDLKDIIKNLKENPEITSKTGELILNSEINNRIEFQKFIVEKINKMNNKPLEQDIILLLTYINNFCLIDSLKCKQGYYIITDLLNYDELDNYKIEEGDKYNTLKMNRLLNIIKQKNTTNILPYIYNIIDNNLNPYQGDKTLYVNYKNYALLKLKEALHLGLNYKGLLPVINTDGNFTVSTAPLFQIVLNPKFSTNPISHKFFKDSHFLNWNQMPYFGNYLLLNDKTSDEQKLSLHGRHIKYYKLVQHKYRPPIVDTEALKDLADKYMFKSLLRIVLYTGYNFNNLYNIIDSNSKLSKGFTDIYQYITFLHDLIEDGNIKKNITQIISNLNTYNANLLLYYYLFSPDKKYKIPKFNYYELPMPNVSGKFLYFNDGIKEIDLDNLESINDTIPDSTVRDISSNYTLNTKDSNNYHNAYSAIQQNIISGKYIIDTNSLIQAKASKLPPSIKSVLTEFYKYNIILLLKDKFATDLTSITNKIKVLRVYEDTTTNLIDDNVSSYYIFAKLVEELVKEQMTYHIQSETFRILSASLNNSTIQANINDLLLKPGEFELGLNDTDVTGKPNKDYILSSYQFSKVEELKEPTFIIYPEEYSNAEILKSKYELVVNNKLFEKLLNSNINPYVLDANNQSAIYPVLKFHNSDIIGELKKSIDYREYSDMNAYNFLYSEYTNHTEKLTGKVDNFKDWIENFVSYQKNEVKTLILSNDKFGNNVPNYLEDSFNVICYIANQYLSESIYKMTDNTNIKTLFDISSNDFGKYLYANEIISKLNIYDLEEANIIDDINENIKKEIKQLEKSISKLSNGKTKEKLQQKIQDISKNIIMITSGFGSSALFNEPKIIKRYEHLKSLTQLLSKLIKYNLNESNDLLTFKIIKKETINLLSNKINNLEQMKTIGTFYDHTNKLSDIYFTFGIYADNNKVMKFTRELLVFMTKQFICYPYTMVLRKVLTVYFKSISPNDDTTAILQKVNYCLTNQLLTEGNKSIENILYKILPEKIVLNSVQIFNNQAEEYDFTPQTIKELLDSITNILTINPVLAIPQDSPFFKNTIKEINAYFDTFTNKTVTNWLVVIENVFKFNINQGRIINSILKLVS